MQRTRGELTNDLALTELEKDITRQKQKLQEAEDERATDETTERDIRSRIKNLEDERAARLEAASANKEELRGQINRIKETINKVLKEDTTLLERLKTLFKERDITVVSILTANRDDYWCYSRSSNTNNWWHRNNTTQTAIKRRSKRLS